MGSINQQRDSLKKESKYIIKFDKANNVTSPAGLVSINNYDAANLNGELIILEFE